MADITNVQLGVCELAFNGVNLGHTIEGVEVSYEPEYTDVSVDKYGNTPVEKYLVGEKLMVKTKLTEYTVALLKQAMPMGSFAGAGNARLTLGSNAGKKATDYAYQLVLHPISEGTRRHDIVLHKAFCHSPIVLPHKNDEQKAYEVEFTAMLDESKSNGNYLGFIGDSTL
jgi:hypothetical protein